MRCTSFTRSSLESAAAETNPTINSLAKHNAHIFLVRTHVLLIYPCEILSVTPTHRHVVFHGPINEVKQFFEGLGFVCPRRKDLPSFLQEVTTPSGNRVWVSL